ncbi:hypothetical protein GS399_03645 [Pedobacter sp. HMF7647]|uniref:FAD-binding domain-containing protein n=1 Tax=Hufsiella arboris TaxID=2695275 RepID=A0A7K1Y660_9SPHI|nr:hypothetical protein [Hufsiella arboris]
MITSTDKKQVLIVGAGPSGLMMAAQLLRYGIQPVIIDQKDGPTNQSKALALQARSLEIYRQLGVIDDVLSRGDEAKGLKFHQEDKVFELNLEGAGNGQTEFPYIFMLEQSKNERVLLNYLTNHVCAVSWRTTLKSLKQNDREVEAVLVTENGESTVNFEWVVGADGAHSIVRKLLNIEFKGSTYPQYYYLADLTLREGFKKQVVQVFTRGHSLAAAFPMRDEGRFRFIGALPENMKSVDDLSFDDVRPYLEQAVGARVEVSNCEWFTSYKLHHRMAESFHLQRCFLIGDAAHIHSPVGGQGMNTGLQDAYNLSWKLVGVINGQYHSKILNSYQEERMPVAKQLLKTTDKLFTIIISKNWLSIKLRNFLVPLIIPKIWSNDKIRGRFFKMVSQIGISYRHSSVNVHHSHLSSVKAGDRLPYLEFYDEKKEETTDLHSWFNKTGFTILVLGTFDERFLFSIAQWITLNYPQGLNFFYLPYSKRNIAFFHQFHISYGQKKLLIVRPDMYIGYMNDVVDLEIIGNYLKNIIGWKKSG